MSKQSKTVEIPELVSQLRITGFLVGAAGTQPEGVWKLIGGAEPENINRVPAKHLMEENGPYVDDNAASLVVIQQPERIDIRLLPKPLPELKFENIGPFPNIIDPFVTAAKHWLSTDPPVKRLAFGSVLVQQVADETAGLAILSGVLPSMELQVEGLKDFLWKMNKPIHSKVQPHLRINRLASWSHPLATIVSGTVGPSSPATLNEPVEIHSVRVELDVNTSADYHDQFNASTLSELLDELVTEAKDFCSKGGW